jgi:hypothetical protein
MNRPKVKQKKKSSKKAAYVVKKNVQYDSTDSDEEYFGNSTSSFSNTYSNSATQNIIPVVQAHAIQAEEPTLSKAPQDVNYNNDEALINAPPGGLDSIGDMQIHQSENYTLAVIGE